MNAIKSMWGELVESKTEQEEHRIIEKVQQYISDQHITIQVTAVDSKGNEMSLNSLSENDDVAVKVIFNAEGQSFEAIGWKPHSIDNIFILFEE